MLATVVKAQKAPEPVSWKTQGLSVTQQQVKTDKETISYTATTGYMDMRDERDTLKANLFFIAYTKNGEPDPAKRPILFSFNGGPGSSSVWLHMGALGPKLVKMTEEGNSLPPPYEYVDNPHTWLDKADLVFIDPMMTGYTRPAGRTQQGEFTGYDNDLRFVGDFIRLYISRYDDGHRPNLLPVKAMALPARQAYRATCKAAMGSMLMGSS